MILAADDPVKYFFERGDFGVIIGMLLVVIVVLWRWGVSAEKGKTTLTHVVENNTHSHNAQVEIVSRLVVEIREAHETNRKFQTDVLEAFKEAISRRPQ